MTQKVYRKAYRNNDLKDFGFRLMNVEVILPEIYPGDISVNGDINVTLVKDNNHCCYKTSSMLIRGELYFNGHGEGMHRGPGDEPVSGSVDITGVIFDNNPEFKSYPHFGKFFNQENYSIKTSRSLLEHIFKRLGYEIKTRIARDDDFRTKAERVINGLPINN